MLLLTMLENEEDKRKFLIVHRAYENKLYRIAMCILHSHALAEDAVQQSWLQVIQHFEKIQQLPWDTLEGYLVVIVKNASRTLLKKEKHADPFPENWDVPAPQSAETDETKRLVEIIRAMPEKYREILELRFVLEYSQQEIAQRTGMNPSTVSTRISRGRQLLIQTLRAEGYYNE
ncbi:MAG: sigma-70 family RNA polymerase sigma factor [Oscillospiraceae bacterium]|nr:sigma-70 family RNA polymerase sigma factor [Oscillospiraceae bacterium]